MRRRITCGHARLSLEVSGNYHVEGRISYQGSPSAQHGRKTRVTVTKTLSVKFGVANYGWLRGVASLAATKPAAPVFSPQKKIDTVTWPSNMRGRCP